MNEFEKMMVSVYLIILSFHGLLNKLLTIFKKFYLSTLHAFSMAEATVQVDSDLHIEDREFSRRGHLT